MRLRGVVVLCIVAGLEWWPHLNADRGDASDSVAAAHLLESVGHRLYHPELRPAVLARFNRLQRFRGMVQHLATWLSGSSCSMWPWS